MMNTTCSVHMRGIYMIIMQMTAYLTIANKQCTCIDWTLDVWVLMNA